MKTSRNTKSIVIAAIILMAGTTLAFAHGGWYDDGYGCGHCMRGSMMGPGYGGRMMGPGYGGRMMGPGYGDRMMGPGYGDRMMERGHCRGMMGPGQGHHRAFANLSDKDRAKIDAAREQFFDETRSLRRNIEDQTYALHKEMRKDAPDIAKVTQLQKQLSKLQDEFDMKAVQHRLEMRKLWTKMVPDRN
jgi:Spy/CpxP family protein refolding chaperone